jgi:carbonic anhydrase-like protein
MEANDVRQLQRGWHRSEGCSEARRRRPCRDRAWWSAVVGARGRGGADHTDPDEALDELKTGNARYVSHPELCTIDLAEQRDTVAAHQAPWASIISCADSRVPPELIFGGHGVGELFVARNAGNLVDTATLGTAEYGAAVLGSPLIVVLAHTSCGAVKAACDIVTKNATYPGAIGPMIDPYPTRGDRRAERGGGFRQQRGQGERSADGQASDGGEYAARRFCRGREAEDRLGDL